MSRKVKSLRVLFSGTEHRERRRETIRHPPPGITFVTVGELDRMRRDHQLSYNPREKGVLNNLRHLARVWTANNRIASRYRDGIDVVYSPGYLLFGDLPYVVEIDNVVVLAYYKLSLLKILKPFIAWRLRLDQCRAIVCVSNAARESVQQYFRDPVIDAKCVVVYPYAGAPLPVKKPTRTVTFLFVATNFYLKGGKEVVNAFWALTENEHEARLVIVTQRHLIEPTLRKRLEADRRITLVEADKTKDELFRAYYAKADAFVLPTYQDSFGMVFLEALRAGLPIITTRMFATPEMVLHGKNGFLIDSPIAYFTPALLPNRAWWERDKAAYARTHAFPGVERALVRHMTTLIRDRGLLARMRKASHALLRERFGEERRQRALGEVLRR